jgi:hypothetical protein
MQRDIPFVPGWNFSLLVIDFIDLKDERWNKPDFLKGDPKGKRFNMAASGRIWNVKNCLQNWSQYD